MTDDKKYAFYSVDCETTNLSCVIGDIIELSIIRMNDGEQKTWFLKPLNEKGIDPGALRVNGAKLEDLLHQTQFGRDTYQDPNKVIVEVENWLGEDGVSSEKRFLCGQNVYFDKSMMEQLWIKCEAKDSFPFGRRVLDSMIVELFMDYAKGSFAEGYSLNNLTKKYGVKNEKAHSAAADTLAAKEVLEKQVAYFKKLLKTE